MYLLAQIPALIAVYVDFVSQLWMVALGNATVCLLVAGLPVTMVFEDSSGAIRAHACRREELGI
jgi:hypothetical protein